MPSIRRLMRSAVVATALSLTAAIPFVTPATAVPPSAPSTQKWVGTWGAAQSGASDNGCRDCTIRNVVHTSVGGTQARVHLSNTFGTEPLLVGHTTVALPAVASSAQVAPGTMRHVKFNGRQKVTIPVGGTVISDPVDINVPADQDLLVTTYTPGYSTPMSVHWDARQQNFFTRGRDAAGATKAADFPEVTQTWHFVTQVDVTGGTARGSVVTFGDSITDGAGSTLNVNHRWPNFLAARIQPRKTQLGVVNTAIGGNRILRHGDHIFGRSGLSRFRRDVLDRPGVRTVVILQGINDIQQTPHQTDASKIIAGLREMADQARDKNIRVVGGTLTPFKGWWNYTPQLEATRQAVNEWIRTTDAFDSVADFDAALRDPADPQRMLPVYDNGDHLHPNDIGYAAMADAVDLSQL